MFQSATLALCSTITSIVLLAPKRVIRRAIPKFQRLQNEELPQRPNSRFSGKLIGIKNCSSHQINNAVPS